MCHVTRHGPQTQNWYPVALPDLSLHHDAHCLRGNLVSCICASHISPGRDVESRGVVNGGVAQVGMLTPSPFLVTDLQPTRIQYPYCLALLLGVCFLCDTHQQPLGSPG